MVMLRRFGFFSIAAAALSACIALAVDLIIAPFRAFAARMPMPRLPSLASVADLIAPAAQAFKADRFESQYMKRAAPRGC